MYINETTIKVRYVETDQMGVVHHSNYYAWFEVGRGEFILQSGLSYSEIEKNDIMLPLVESNCKYIEGAKYEDIVVIQTWISEITPVKVIFNYAVVRSKDNKIIAKGSTTHAFVNKSFKIVNMKKKNLEIWNKLLRLKDE
jgi:acyl-CoA thioester hydrolase, YbgC/YbaW family